MNKSVKEARGGLIPSEETENLPVVTLRVKHREYDMIIAALRFWQRESSHGSEMYEIAADHGDPLSDKEIDELIERVQFGSPQPQTELLEFVSHIARLTKESEYAEEDVPASEDWIATLNGLIAKARRILKSKSTKSTKSQPLPIIVLEGGLVQDVFVPVPEGTNKRSELYTSLEYDLFDYDIFDGNTDAEIVQHWNYLSDEAQAYFKKHVPDAWKPVRKAIARHKAAQRRAAKKGGK